MVCFVMFMFPNHNNSCFPVFLLHSPLHVYISLWMESLAIVNLYYESLLSTSPHLHQSEQMAAWFFLLREFIGNIKFM